MYIYINLSVEYYASERTVTIINGDKDSLTDDRRDLWSLAG